MTGLLAASRTEGEGVQALSLEAQPIRPSGRACGPHKLKSGVSVILSRAAANALQSISQGQPCDPPISDETLAEMIAANVARAIYAGGARMIVLTPDGYDVAESIAREAQMTRGATL